MDDQRKRALQVAFEQMVLCADAVKDGQPFAKSWNLYITINLVGVLDRPAFTSDELDAIERNAIDPPEYNDELQSRSPAKWASEQFSTLLGHGKNWFRKCRDKHPPWPLAGRRYSPSWQMDSRRKSHPGEFDRFTRSERVFLRLPSAVQVLIEDAIDTEIGREVVQEGDEPIEKYLMRPATEREQFVLPRLVAVVSTCIRAMSPVDRSAAMKEISTPYTKANGERARRNIWPLPLRGP